MGLEVFRSSAGSGKTTTLVKAYLHLVLHPQGNGYHSILAITFSNKAANELKIRIIESLAQLAEADEPRKLQSAAALFWKEFSGLHASVKFDHVRNRAGLLLRNILHHYGTFSVSTIDRFTHRLIRAFAFDLRLPSNFVVDLDTGTIVHNATLDLLQQAGKDEQLTKVLIEFLREQFDLEKNGRIEEPIAALGSFIYNDEGLSRIGSLEEMKPEAFLQVRKLLLQAVQDHKAGFASLAKKAIELIGRTGIPETAFSYRGEIPVLLNKLIQGNGPGLSLQDSRACNSLAAGNFFSKDALKANPELKRLIEPVEAALMQIGEELLSHNEDKIGWLYTCDALSSNIYSMAVMGALRNIILSYRTSESKLGIAEFNHLVSTAIASQPAPFILERAGERFSHIMIDEFQDTSLLQWQNLVPLVENCLAQGGKVLLVGDVKQSIYRFRGAEARQLNELPIVPDPAHRTGKRRMQALSDDFKHSFLQANYRSANAIVSFNNYFFRKVMDELDPAFGSIRDYYVDVNQQVTRLNETGSVCLRDMDALSGVSMPLEEHLDFVVELIGTYLKAGFSYRDITLLFRNNKEIGLVASALWEAHIPMISSESLSLGSSSRVGFLMAYFKWLVCGKQEIHHSEWLLELCRSLGKTSEDVAALLIEQPIGKSLENELGLSAFEANLAGKGIYAVINDLIALLGWDVRSDAFLSTLLDWVFEHGSDADPAALLEHWSSGGSSTNIVLPEGRNAVTLMTVHKAKGLEFEVVIMPFADWGKGMQAGKLWAKVDPDKYFGLSNVILNNQANLEHTELAMQRSLERLHAFCDDLNLLYVALTRPRKHLFMMVRSHSSSKSHHRQFLINALADGEAHPVFPDTVTWGDFPSPVSVVPSLQEEQSGETHLLPAVKPSPLSWFFSAPENAEAQVEQRLGIAMHDALLGSDSPDSFRERFSYLLQEFAEHRDLLEKSGSWLCSPELDAFWHGTGTILTEQSLLDTDGSLHRPDRMRIQGDAVTIWDLKTGDVRDTDRQQVLRYCDLLKKMNYKIQGAYLIYTGTRQQVQVS